MMLDRFRRLLASVVLGRYSKRAEVDHLVPWAENVIRSYNWIPWQSEYHRHQLRRYCATLELLDGVAKSDRILEIGAMPFGLTTLLLDRGFQAITCTSAEEVHAGESGFVGSADAGSLVVSLPRTDGGFRVIPALLFDAERARWSAGDESYDGVMMCEVLEHLARDPMAALAESNRVLRPGGWILITTPNGVSARVLMAVLKGECPSMDPVFHPESIHRRHHREYTPSELRTLLSAAGFTPSSIRTQSIHRPGLRHAFALALMRLGDRMSSLRGEFIMAFARKSGAVTDRYPVAHRLYPA